jgi:hypothetical protein
MTSTSYSLICSAIFVFFYAYHKHVSAREFILKYTGTIVVQFIILKHVFDTYIMFKGN